MSAIVRRMLAGREHLHVIVPGIPSASVADEARSALDRAVATVREEGFDPRHIVRSRLLARDGDVRKIAGAVRLDVLVGDLRGASSSYIDPDRLPQGSTLAVELVALRAAPGAEKRVLEYDPVIAPPRLVMLDGMIYLSGMTDTTAGYDAQLMRIGPRIDTSLLEAGSGRSRIVGVDAFMAHSVQFDHAWPALEKMFTGFEGPLLLSAVTGFSAEEKRIEIETTARA